MGQRLNIEKSLLPQTNRVAENSRADTPQNQNGPASQRKPRWSRRFAAFMRWLHIYLSMLAFTIVLFFSITGLTLNHADWFLDGHEHRVATTGSIDRQWLHAGTGQSTDAESDDAVIDKLQIVEVLRRDHEIKAALAEFSVDESECRIVFKGPGFAADVVLDRQSGQYEIVQSRHGFVSVLNDLHKGRDTGSAWSWVIDISAVATAVISLTGLILLFYLKQRRGPGLILAVIGTAIVVVVYRFWVP